MGEATRSDGSSARSIGDGFHSQSSFGTKERFCLSTQRRDRRSTGLDEGDTISSSVFELDDPLLKDVNTPRKPFSSFPGEDGRSRVPGTNDRTSCALAQHEPIGYDRCFLDRSWTVYGPFLCGGWRIAATLRAHLLRN